MCRWFAVVSLTLASALLYGNAGADPVLTRDYNTDRAGIDYTNFVPSSANPDWCIAACAKSSSCDAYTYVKPGYQGSNPRCWLKTGVPAQSSNSCCYSGKKSDKMYLTKSGNKDRAGSDYKSLWLATADPELCLAACAKESQCKAYTYVKPGIQGAQARCWLKSAVPGESSNSCCTSGVKTTLKQQARSFAITKWDGNCGGSQRDWWDDMCMAWRHKMGAKGWEQWWNNYSLVRNPKFADNAKVSWGEDDNWNGMDAGEAALICTHGGHNATVGWSGSMHTDVGHGCSINTTQMQVGPASGGDLRFLHLSSCNSINWDEKGKWWGPAAGRVHVVTGFHGYMYIGSSYVDEYEDLANDGFSRGVGDVWMDKMHHVDHWYNSWKTVCPVALGFGETSAQAANALNEKYNDRWPDRSANWMHWTWWSGCDPDGAGALP